MFSKETLDRAKLAKQYIESRYESLITLDHKNRQNWEKIMALVDPGTQNLDHIVQSIAQNQSIKKRLERQKDSLDNYELHSIIGRGAFGEVRLAKNIISNEIVAIKRLQKKYLVEKKQIYNAYLERDLMSNCSSPFLVQLKSTFQDQQYLYLVMEYVQGGDLLKLLIEKDILPEDEVRFYIAELVKAVEEIHNMNYIHRDIKPDNILIDKTGHIKISDFGLSKYLQNEDKPYRVSNKGIPSQNQAELKLTKVDKVRKLDQIRNKDRAYSKVGTPDYISPEVLTDKKYSHSVDLWGIGVVMFECLFGYPPFTDQNSKEVCAKVVNWIEYLEFPDHIRSSTAAKMLILGLVTDSSRRLTIAEVKSHPFFEGVDWDNLHLQMPPFIPEVNNELDCSNFDEYEIVIPWTEQQKDAMEVQKMHQGRSRSLEKLNFGYVQQKEQTDQILANAHSEKNLVNFKFAGFEYRKIPIDPLESVAANMQKNNKPKNGIKKQSMKSSEKRQKLSNVKSDKGLPRHRLLKSKKHQTKAKVSELGNTTDSLSYSIGRVSSSKQLLRTLMTEQSVNKQRLTYKSSKKMATQNSCELFLKKRSSKNKLKPSRQNTSYQAQQVSLKRIGVGRPFMQSSMRVKTNI